MATPLKLPDDALDHAHLPALLMALVHLTGDEGLLADERRAVYDSLDPAANPDEGGYSAQTQADIRARAKTAIAAHLANPKPSQPLSPQTLRCMMDFVAGAPVPEHYADFLLDELGVGVIDTKTPHWETPKLRGAAKGMHVVIVGAGMSGLLAGIRLGQAGVPFTIVEKNADVGGTWFENTYPGCRVDNPNHMYSYSFEPNHAFPQFFSTQPVLLDYFRHMADKHDLRRHIRFETTVREAVFDEAAATWRVTVKTSGGGSEVIEASALITAVGQLNRPKMPDIEGRERFAGPSFHSSSWRHDVDLQGKRVAVIGTGASAYQFVPKIAPTVGHLDVFQRTPPWTLPKATYHHDVPEGKKWLLEHVPFYDRWYRFYLFWTLTDGVYDSVKADEDWRGSPRAVGAANAELSDMLAEAIRLQATDRPDLLAKVLPDYPFGGKRALVDNGVWIDALKRDNVDLVTDPIARIAPEGVVTEDGTLHPADVLIYGTGFQASRFLWPMRIVGRDGVELEQAWKGDARAYLGMTTPGFPNLFILYGPNTNIVVNGSIIFFSECSVRYTVGCLKLLAETGARTLEVRQEVHDAFNAKVDAANAKMAWGAPQVSSWYKNATGRVSQNWPFPLVDYWNATVAPDTKDFIIDAASVSLRAHDATLA